MLKLPEDSLHLNNQLCFSLYTASRKVTALYNPLLKKLDITYTQYITLLVLWEHKKLSVKEIGDLLFLDSGTLTPLLKKLESKGLITRMRSKEDERSVYLEITPKGMEMKKEALDYLPNLLCTTNIGMDELVELRGKLQLLIKSLQLSETED